MKLPAEMTKTRVHVLAGLIRAGHLAELDEPVHIADTALTDAEDLRAENDKRCPACQRYAIEGEQCEHCGAEVP